MCSRPVSHHRTAIVSPRDLIIGKWDFIPSFVAENRGNPRPNGYREALGSGLL